MIGDELETQVIESLELIFQKYQSINALADQMLNTAAETGTFDANMILLNEERKRIEQLHFDNQSLSDKYRATRSHASEAVTQKTDTIGKLIQGLMMKISQLERKTKGCCDQLLPQIQNGVRALQMKNAYGKYA